MIKINYQNLIIKPNLKKYHKILKKIRILQAPPFEKTKPNLSEIKKKVKKYKKYQTVILLGNGGSRTSAFAFINALYNHRNKTHFEFLSSAEPEPILNIRKKYSPRNTLILVVSKSGTNINNLEPLLLLLLDYPILVITGRQKNTLSEIAQRKKWEIIYHPEVEGRYSGLTSCGLAPAYLAGLDIKKIYAGAKRGYGNYRNTVAINRNSALKLALYFADLEKKGFSEIFASIYSTSLLAFLPLIVQLIHESTGKNKKGQTIFGDYSPESQHHTLQRFFGGRKNVIGLFLGVEKPAKDLEIKVPSDLSDASYKNSKLSILNGSAQDTMTFDRQGVIRDAESKKIPTVGLLVDKISPESIGEFMVFWQYFAMYSALLRHQNPFDEPEVEESKAISFNFRAKREGIIHRW